MGGVVESLGNSIRSGWNSLLSWISTNKWKIIGIGAGLVIFGGLAVAGVGIGALVGGSITVLQTTIGAEVLGGVIGAVVGGVIGGRVIYKAFRYDPNRRQVFQATSQNSFDTQYSNLQQVQWEQLIVSDQQLQQLDNIVSQAQFQQDAKLLSCPFSKKVISKPAMIFNHTCSQGKKVYQEKELRSKKCCNFCQAAINQQYIVIDSPQTRAVKHQVFGFRCRIRKTYLLLREDQKPDWKTLIEKYMGNDYVSKYL